MKRAYHPCMHCGTPTRSKGDVCRGCYVAIHPSKTRCIRCGGMTQRKDGVCQPCENGWERCTTCGIVPTKNGECSACEAVKRDDESPWDLSEGYWRTRRSGTKEWVPLLPDEREVVLLAEERACRGCSTMFRPSHALQRYHDEACRRRADYRRRSTSKPHPVEGKAGIRKRPLPTTGTLRQFTDDECRDGRARYVQGDRSPITLAQSREYGRVMKAARRQQATENREEKASA